MAFLSGILSSIGKWLLEKLGDYLAKGYKKLKRRTVIDKQEQAIADSKKSLVDQIYKLEDEISRLDIEANIHRSSGALVPKNISKLIVSNYKKINKIEEKMRELSLKTNSRPLN